MSSTEFLELAEKKLKGLKPPRDVWVNCEDGSILGLVKIETKFNDARWRLVYGPGDSDTAQPLADCPILVRARLAKFIPQLHEAIIKDKEEFVPVVEEAIKTLKSYLYPVTPVEETQS